jgi:hypothetical protein
MRCQEQFRVIRLGPQSLASFKQDKDRSEVCDAASLRFDTDNHFLHSEKALPKSTGLWYFAELLDSLWDTVRVQQSMKHQGVIVWRAATSLAFDFRLRGFHQSLEARPTY